MSNRGTQQVVTARARPQQSAPKTKPQPKPPSLAKRKSTVTEQVASALGANRDAALTAALEVVNERMAWDTALQQSLRQRYAELEALAVPKQKPDLGPAPKPIRAAGLDEPIPDLNKLDPYRLLYHYGPDQLRAVLMRSTQRLLRTAVDTVQAREPNAKPASRTKIPDMIDYIVEHVAGSGY